MTKSELRMQIKEDARKQLYENKKSLMLAAIILGVISIFPVILSEYIITSYKINIVINMISVFTLTPLAIGFNIMALDCIKGKKVYAKDIVKGFNMMYQAYGSMLIQRVIIFILTLPLAMIPIVLVDDSFKAMLMMNIITILANLFFYTIFSQVEYIIADKTDIGPIEAIKKSIYIIRGHIGEYIVLTLSLIGWIILVGITFGIALIWVGPYIQLTYANFYEHIKKDKLNNYKEVKNSNLFIGLFIGLLLCGYTAMEENLTEKLLAPPVVKTVIKDNNLKLISSEEESNYYLMDAEKEAYTINGDYDNLSNLTKYTVIVRNNPLDAKKGDNIDSTVVYIIADGDKVLGVSCEPYDSTEKAESYNTNLGRYDIKGELF
jgi:uncharacterized membrane protein